MMEFFEALWNDLQGAFGDTVNLGTNTVTTLNIIVWSLFIGFILAIAFTLYNKLVVGSIVRGLIGKKAFSEDDALTASEVGCKNIFVRFALRKNSTLRRIVYASGDTETTRSSESFDTVKFYIPDKELKKAEVIYGKKGINVKTVVIAIVALVIIAFASLYIVPDLIQMLNNFISGLSGKSNIL